ncbi:unnamed protein product, partial [Meganyctiphanes norvegica]
SSKRRGEHLANTCIPVVTKQPYSSPPYIPSPISSSATPHSGPGSASSQYLQLPLSSGEQHCDGLADHGNYAVPPPHPRPLIPSSEDTHFSGSGDYDNAPLKVLETSARNRQPWDGNSESMNSGPITTTTTTTTTSVSEMQVSEYIAWRNERLGNRSSSLPGPTIRPGHDDNHSSTERLHPAQSEDELSAGSGSPHSRRRKMGGNITPSSTSSRNQSPRTVGTEARLRHAATPRKNNRNSANLGSSSLQEELFRLINPDYISDSECIGSNLGNQNHSGERPRAYTVSHVGGTGSQGSRSNNSSLDRVSIKSGGAVSNSGGINTSITPGAGSQSDMIPLNNNNDNVSTNVNSSSTQSHQPQFSAQNVMPVNGTCTALPSLSVMPHGHTYPNFPVGPLSNQNIGHNHKQHNSTGENNNNSSSHQQQQRGDAPEVVVLTARPATVISNSSATSSPAPTTDQSRPTVVASSDSRIQTSDNRGQPLIGDRNTSGLPNLNEPGSSGVVSNNLNNVEDEWTSLVNTATAAIKKSGDLLATHPSPPLTNASLPIPTTAPQTQNTQPFIPPSLQPTAQRSVEENSDPSLVDRVAVLERALLAEQQRSEQLVDEVGQLRTENRKLQEDSRAAAQQLHQFTEWFFNTIDKT